MDSKINVPDILQPSQNDMFKLVKASCQRTSMNSNIKMRDYLYQRKPESQDRYGNIINLGDTWEKLMLAARIIVTIENPEDVCAVASRQHQQRAVIKYGTFTGASTIAGRFTPGSFTNQKTKQFREPRLIIVGDPTADKNAVKEASYVGIPCIAFCDADTNLQYVDVAIPVNTKGFESIGLIFWFLAREVLRLRGTIERSIEWPVKVDLFFFRKEKDVEKEQETQLLSVVAPTTFQPETQPISDLVTDVTTTKPMLNEPSNWDATPAPDTGFGGGGDEGNWGN